MDLYQWWPLVMFAFVSTFSPGPNNIMLMTSGANVGFKKTIPHMAGVTLGYLVYLAVKIVLSKPSQSSTTYKPMTFLSAAMFQWVNPKGWSMALTAVSVYNYTTSWVGLAIIAIVFAMVNVPSVSVWTAAGKQLSQWMQSGKLERVRTLD